MFINVLNRQQSYTSTILFTSVLLCCCIHLEGCGVQTQKRQLTSREDVGTLVKDAAYFKAESPYLKVHLLNGHVYVLSDWNVDEHKKIVTGTGQLLDVNREILEKDFFSIPLDSVAIFETNVVHTSGSVAALAVITGASVALTIYCISNPKACFGSCPTFYVQNEGVPILQAEGFSASISPALEGRDIDALYRVKPTSRDFELHMKNEALETHVVRYADLLIARRTKGGRVFAASNDTFWQASKLIKPSQCIGPEGDCLKKVKNFDGLQRISETDSTYLGAKETIDIEFRNVPDAKLGLVIACRQSLLSTYLFYQSLSYMGNSVGKWLAMMERGDEVIRKRSGGIGRLLGGIEVLTLNSQGEWASVGGINETGPLATDIHLVPLPQSLQSQAKIRLRLTKGHWRIDYVALAVLGKRVEPIRLKPSLVRRNSIRDDTAREALLDTTKQLITLPGDVVTLMYRLPEDFVEYELFLESRGYYLEWIRDEWVADENLSRATMIFLNPELALRKLAPEFKQVEAEIEELFWNSRYAQ